MKEISPLEMIGRSLAKIAAGAGVAALLIWLVLELKSLGLNVELLERNVN